MLLGPERTPLIQNIFFVKTTTFDIFQSNYQGITNLGEGFLIGSNRKEKSSNDKRGINFKEPRSMVT